MNLGKKRFKFSRFKMILPCMKCKLKYGKNFILLKIRLAIVAAPEAATGQSKAKEAAGAKA